MDNVNHTPLLEGIEVLDLSQGIAGPYCGGIFQQQGAQVIKLEPPSGDWARHMGTVKDGFSALVLAYNAGKRGVCVDAGGEAGRALIRRLAAQVDIVIQNFRHGVVDRLGIGYEAISAVNPRVVYLSISGFGGHGPLASQPATDNVVQAMSGMLSANRDATGAPKRNGLLLADLATAMYAAQLGGAALFRRSVDGRGRHIELSMLEAAAALQAGHIADSVFGADLPRTTYSSIPGGIFEVADGHLTLGTLNNAMFSRLCHALGDPAWANDADYASNTQRLAQAERLNGLVAALLKARPMAWWLPRLQAADVLHAPIHDYAGFMADEQVVASQLFSQVRNDGHVDVPRARHPGTPGPLGGVESAPRIGQHTVEVLQRHGFSGAEIDELLKAGVVQQNA